MLMRCLWCGGWKKWRRNAVKIGKISAVLGGRRPPRRIKAHSATADHKVLTTVMQAQVTMHTDGSDW